MKPIWIAAIVIILAAGSWYAFSANRATAPTNGVDVSFEETGTNSSGEVTIGDGPTITLTDAGFSPSTLTVSEGSTVRFVNESSGGMWVGSDDHPTHTNYDGTSTREHCADGAANNGTFDQCAPTSTDSSWEYTFTKTGTFGYHNHVGASNTGTIVVVGMITP